MDKTYIALDLETTGFEAENDQVIEIAAIKFQGKKIIDTFETLVNPQVPIPAMVSHITGITQEHIANAPHFSAIQEKLVEFLGDHPIIGHNIDFDLSFLKAKGLPIKNKQYDTLHLAGILLPGLASYSLDTISRVLKLEHTNKHRAMSDTHVCFDLFNLLFDKIAEIPANTLQEIQSLIKKSDWHLGEIFLEAKPAKTSTKVDKKETKKTLENPFPNLKLDQPADFFNDAELAASLFPNYEPRPTQQQLSEDIFKSFSNQSHLIAEAPTGSGKTFAYLLAGALWNKKFQEKVVISTNTNNLQDQIFQKDFPVLEKLFPNLKIALLKGRKNYFSPARFNHIISKEKLEEHEILMAIKVILWLLKTETGDLEELNLHNKELTLLDEICCLGSQTMPSPSPKGKDQQLIPEEKFLTQARLNAETADILVVNHSLLIQDSISANHLLPDFHYLIIDEAHHLEKTATDALIVDLTPNRFRKILENLQELELQYSASPTLFSTPEANNLPSKIRLQSDQAEYQASEFFNSTNEFLEEFGKPLNLFPLHLTLNFVHLKTTQWDSLKNQLTLLNEQIRQLLENLNLLIKNLLVNGQTDLFDLEYYQNQLSKLSADSTSLLENIEANIVWINRTHDENLHFQKAPLEIGHELQTLLYQNKKSIIFTSATLTTNGNFNYIRHELGLTENVQELKLPSHFSYPDQVKIIIPEDLPLDPREDAYLEDCQNLINQIIQKNGGRTLVLFTSKKDLSRIFHQLAPKLKHEGFNLLAQGISGGRGKIISHFMDEPESSALMGTNSFWEGIDLVGDLLNCLIIQKLPFDPPEDPIFRARSRRFRNEFNDYSLPRAILRFKQGFGRLIRSSQDTGNTIMLDSRLVHKEYGKNFLASLPEGIQIHQCSKNQVIDLL
ncbi:MAG: helicase C-terminal domain-containing protein [Candidatus Altimarinota bacterium]